MLLHLFLLKVTGKVQKNFTLKLYGPFLWIGFNCLKASATSRRQFTFYHLVPRYSWYSFYRPRKDERLSRPWSHPAILNTGPLDWKSSALTTRPSLHKVQADISHNYPYHKKLSIFVGKKRYQW